MCLFNENYYKQFTKYIMTLGHIILFDGLVISSNKK